jgi:hypothetical protein
MINLAAARLKPVFPRASATRMTMRRWPPEGLKRRWPPEGLKLQEVGLAVAAQNVEVVGPPLLVHDRGLKISNPCMPVCLCVDVFVTESVCVVCFCFRMCVCCLRLCLRLPVSAGLFTLIFVGVGICVFCFRPG